MEDFEPTGDPRGPLVKATDWNNDSDKLECETVKKVSEDITKMLFNTAISKMMVCTNAFTGAEVVPLKEFTLLPSVLNPFVPHLSEEINTLIGNKSQLVTQPWPEHDETALIETELQLVVQVNGKLRDKITVSKDASKEEIEPAAQVDPKVLEQTDGKTIRKIIVVPDRLVNIVANCSKREWCSPSAIGGQGGRPSRKKSIYSPNMD